MVNLKINNIPVSVPEGTTILEAARSVGIRIPTLCYLKEINAIGACRICVVEVKGARSMVAACVYPVAEGMEVTTNSAAVIKARKTTLELILSDHQKNAFPASAAPTASCRTWRTNTAATRTLSRARRTNFSQILRRIG